MDWRCGSSSRIPILQAQSPEFKPQSQLKKKKRKKKKRKKKRGRGRKRKYWQVTSFSLCAKRMSH
jgi:hypothetical protein